MDAHVLQPRVTQPPTNKRSAVIRTQWIVEMELAGGA